MRIIDQSVEVISPRSLEHAIEELKDIETAARTCYDSGAKTTEDSYLTLIENLRKRGHESPLEFADIKLRLVTSRDVLAELTRHRLVSFCVRSQRYVNESKDDGGIAFIKPLFYDNVYKASRIWEDGMCAAEAYYNSLIDAGMKNQDARKVLPNSTACIIVMKCNLRELQHIYSLRSSTAAYPEMRELMRLLKIEVDKVYPGFLR